MVTIVFICFLLLCCYQQAFLMIDITSPHCAFIFDIYYAARKYKMDIFSMIFCRVNFDSFDSMLYTFHYSFHIYYASYFTISLFYFFISFSYATGYAWLIVPVVTRNYHLPNTSYLALFITDCCYFALYKFEGLISSYFCHLIVLITLRFRGCTATPLTSLPLPFQNIDVLPPPVPS